MSKIIYIILAALTLFGNVINDYSIDEKQHNGESILMQHNSYKILEFSKRVINIRLSSSDVVSVNFEDIKHKPFSKIKVFAKKAGSVNALITFFDNSISQISFVVTNNIEHIKQLVKSVAPNVQIINVNNSIVLKGEVKNNKIKNKIIDLLKSENESFKIIDLVNVNQPDKMVRLKLYVTEINNQKGQKIKNNWSLQSGYTSGETEQGNLLVGYNEGASTLQTAVDMLNAVTLSGGLTLTANKLGKDFNAGLTLNYLKNKGVAKVLDETTLITVENQSSNFLAGGTLMVRTSSTSSDGQPISSVTNIDYGLDLDIKVNDIINDKFINLDISTSSSSLDHANSVDNIPAKNDKAIKTNVVVQNGATIVLGGLINNSNSKNIEGIPLLKDIPIIGELFQSKDFLKGNSELIFFITPTIVDVSQNDQIKKFNSVKKQIVKAKKVPVKKVTTPEDLSNEELHKKRLQDVFGIN
ncbi:MAG: hypothetical protein U9Q33_07445 [Campylobacterota bacterium]|nr:hypothetical protein [Campylobacterota bacterium]